MSGKRLVIMAALGAAIGVGAARAGTPFGGDDTGFVPPDTGTLKCESAVTKNAAKLALAVSICHDKAADAGVKGKTFDEEACETAARGKYDAANAKLTCPSCVDSKAIGDNVESMLDTAANGCAAVAPRIGPSVIGADRLTSVSRSRKSASGTRSSSSSSAAWDRIVRSGSAREKS